MIVVVVAMFTDTGDLLTRFMSPVQSVEVACALKYKGDEPTNNYRITPWQLTPGFGSYIERTQLTCPPAPAKPKPPSEPFDFEKLLDEVESGMARKKGPPAVNRFAKDSNIDQLRMLIADPDTDDKAREEAHIRVLELRLEKQEEALNRFMGIK